jgi:hypothetical protein
MNRTAEQSMCKGPRPVSSAFRSCSRPNTAVATSSSLARKRVWDNDELFIRLCPGSKSAKSGVGQAGLRSNGSLSPTARRRAGWWPVSQESRLDGAPLPVWTTGRLTSRSPINVDIRVVLLIGAYTKPVIGVHQRQRRPRCTEVARAPVATARPTTSDFLHLPAWDGRTRNTSPPTRSTSRSKTAMLA